MTEPTIHELHEAIRQREMLLNEASALLAGGAGEDSPEYEEFLRLRNELPHVTRTPELAHSTKVVRKKIKELRTWLRRMDRALGTSDPVTGILDYLKELLPKYQHAPFHEAKLLMRLIEDIENGAWIGEVEEAAGPVKCSCCDAEFDDEDSLFQHCAYSKGCAR